MLARGADLRRRRAPGGCVLRLALALLAVLGPTRSAAAPSLKERSRTAAVRGPGLEPTLLEAGLARAEQIPHLHALIVARDGAVVAERRFRGPSLDTPVNVKSVSKSIMSALIGIAIGDGTLQGVDQPVAPFFPEYARRIEDPRFREVTIGHLLSMRSGLARTSGEGYGRWVKSRDWIGHVLLAPMLARPGEHMIYSTGNTHLLSAILTRASKKSTYEYARAKLARPLGIALPRWERDPSGLYFGGNQMRLSPRALLRIGELYRNGGRHGERQVIPEDWVRESLTPRTRSIFSGMLYGYGWFIADFAGQRTFFAWGYGGQFIFVVPALGLTFVTTSDFTRGRDWEHLWAIQEILSAYLIPAAQWGEPSTG